MQTLEVTDEQYAFIQHLREELSEQVVGKYGHVRDRDALQFLIDNFDDELEIDEAFEPSDPGDLAVDEGGENAEEISYEEDDGDSTSESGATETGGDGKASDDDMLDRMMNLLETHDDKWEESPSADYRYRVELPDGSTDDVQTKDDVRALLFKHY